MEGVLGWKKMINLLIMTQSNPPYRFLRSLDCPFKVLIQFNPTCSPKESYTNIKFVTQRKRNKENSNKKNLSGKKKNYVLNLPCKTTFHLNTKVRDNNL